MAAGDGRGLAVGGWRLVAAGDGRGLAVGGWQLVAAGAGRGLAVGGWRLVAAGDGRGLAVGGWWLVAAGAGRGLAVGGWRLVAAGDGRGLAVGGWQLVAAGAGRGLAVGGWWSPGAVLNEKTKAAQDSPPLPSNKKRCQNRIEDDNRRNRQSLCTRDLVPPYLTTNRVGLAWFDRGNALGYLVCDGQNRNGGPCVGCVPADWENQRYETLSLCVKPHPNAWTFRAQWPTGRGPPPV